MKLFSLLIIGMFLFSFSFVTAQETTIEVDGGFNFINWFTSTFNIQTFSVVGVDRQCEITPGKTLHVAQYQSIPSGSTYYTYGLTDIFDGLWNEIGEWKDSPSFSCGDSDGCIAEYYSCPHPECSTNSQCVTWYGSGSQCLTKSSTDPNIEYRDGSTFKYCSTGTPEITCYYYPGGGSTCSSRIYLNTCPTDYMGHTLYSSSSTCVSNIPSVSNVYISSFTFAPTSGTTASGTLTWGGGQSPYTVFISDFGDSTEFYQENIAGTSKTISHTYSSSGTYTIQYCIYDSISATPGYCGQKTIIFSSVLPVSLNSFTFAPTVGLTASGDLTWSDGKAPYTVAIENFGDGEDFYEDNIFTKSKTISHTYSSPGTYDINYCIYDDISATPGYCGQKTISFSSVCSLEGQTCDWPGYYCCSGLGLTCNKFQCADIASFYCGDDICQSTETMTTCPEDCGVAPICGDGECEAGETTGASYQCLQDCCHAADANCDGSIDRDELGFYINKWIEGQTSREFLGSIIALWANQ